MVQRGSSATLDATASEGKAPRTERGRRTLRALLDAAAVEFGEKGFHDGSISGIPSCRESERTGHSASESGETGCDHEYQAEKYVPAASYCIHSDITASRSGSST